MNKDKLLICCQIVDQESTVFGFFIRWIEELAKRHGQVTVLCLYQGKHDLEKNFTNVKVITLGKETNPSKLSYILKFYKNIWKYRNEYDKVFVHQNREYILLGGFLWKILGKKVYHWSNHYMGNWLTNTACFFCTKVFFTSKFSYTAKFKNAQQMPVGVDVANFLENKYFENYAYENKINNSILFLARLSPSKYPDMVLKSLKKIEDENSDNLNLNFTATFVGGPDKDKFPNFENEILDLKNSLNFKNKIELVGGVQNSETAKYFLQNQIYVNVAKSGMLDKAIFEAVVCDCLPLTTSLDFNEMIKGIVGDKLEVEQNNVDNLKSKIQELLNMSIQDKKILSEKVKDFVLQNHTLEIVANRLKKEMMV